MVDKATEFPPAVLISAVIPTLNEAENLPNCLASLSWVDQIVVIDSGSRDRTVAIAREHGAEVIEQPFAGFGPQRNRAATAARNDWVLCVDADEMIPPALRDEILLALSRSTHYAGYRLRRRTKVLGKWIRYCGWQRDRVLRLYDRRRGTWDDRQVHERVVLDGDVGDLSNPMDHYSYRDISQFAAKTARYAELGAQDLMQKGRRASPVQVVTAPIGRFIRMFVLQRGFLDGWPGMLVCAIAAWGVFLKYARLWELGRGSARP